MILIVDDDAAVRLSLKLMLRREGYETREASSPGEAMEIVRAASPELIILDMNFSRVTTGQEGLLLLRQIKIFRPSVPVILMTAWGSIPLAVEGIHAGAFDFITKPWDNQALLRRIGVALELNSPAEGGDESADFDRSFIIGRSAGLLNVLDTVKRIAATDAPVLIMGENGTGKELIAEAIHRNSRRRPGPMVKVNLGGIPSSLFESEMFGHRKGAFTGAITDRDGRFALADGGTIFLDEIGELDLNCQVKLLRVLQEHTYEENEPINLMTFTNYDHVSKYSVVLSLSPRISAWSPRLRFNLLGQRLSTPSISGNKHLNNPLLFINFYNSINLGNGFTTTCDVLCCTYGDMDVVTMKPSWQINLGVTKTYKGWYFQINATDIFKTARNSMRTYGRQMVLNKWNYSDSQALRLTIRYSFNSTMSRYKGKSAAQEEKARL